MEKEAWIADWSSERHAVGGMSTMYGVLRWRIVTLMRSSCCDSSCGTSVAALGSDMTVLRSSAIGIGSARVAICARGRRRRDHTGRLIYDECKKYAGVKCRRLVSVLALSDHGRTWKHLLAVRDEQQSIALHPQLRK
ncbi:hypothetical protein MRB53_039000 [Persea americana]|nr:hypothetical protein MRB53_039000 [Persea americana]